MNWSVLKEFKVQSSLGLTFGLIGVLGTGVLSWLLWLPFPDLRIALIQATIGLISLIGSLLMGKQKGRWAMFYWFGVALLIPVCSGILWAAFAWFTGFSPLVLGFWLSLAGFLVVFVLAIPLFSYVSVKKAITTVATSTPNLPNTR